MIIRITIFSNNHQRKPSLVRVCASAIWALCFLPILANGIPVHIEEITEVGQVGELAKVPGAGKLGGQETGFVPATSSISPGDGSGQPKELLKDALGVRLSSNRHAPSSSSELDVTKKNLHNPAFLDDARDPAIGSTKAAQDDWRQVERGASSLVSYLQSRPSDAAASLRRTPEIRDAMLAFEQGGGKYQEDTIHQAYLSVKVHGTLKTDGTYEATGDKDTAIEWMGFLYLASYPNEKRPIPDLDYVRQLSRLYLHLIYLNRDLAPEVRALADVILDTEPIKTADEVASLGQVASRRKNPVQPEAPTFSADPTTAPPSAGPRQTKQALDEIEKRQQTLLQSIYPSREQKNQKPVLSGDEATEAATSQSSGDEATQAGSQADAPGQESTRFGVTFPKPTHKKLTPFKPIRFKGGETPSDIPPGAVELPRPPPQLSQVDPSTGLVDTQKVALPSLPDQSTTQGQTPIERTGIPKGFLLTNPARQKKAAQALQPLPLPVPQSGSQADKFLRTSTLHDSGASSSNVGRGKGLALKPESQVQPVELLRQQFTTRWSPFGGTHKLDTTAQDRSLRRERAGSILQAQPHSLPQIPPQTQTQTRPLQTTQLQSQLRPPPKTRTQPPLKDNALPLPTPPRDQPVSEPPPRRQPAPLPKPPTDKESA